MSKKLLRFPKEATLFRLSERLLKELEKHKKSVRNQQFIHELVLLVLDRMCGTGFSSSVHKRSKAREFDVMLGASVDRWVRQHKMQEAYRLVGGQAVVYGPLLEWLVSMHITLCRGTSLGHYSGKRKKKKN